MKKFALSLLAATLFLAACSKDDDNKIDASKSFTYNGEALNTPFGYLFDAEDAPAIAFADQDLLKPYTGTASAVVIDLDTLIIGQTYTFMHSDSTGYDRKKNFEFAATFFKQPFAGDDFTDDAKGLDTLTAGTVTINKTQDTYNVAYELKYNTITVKGQYNGALKISE
jgi:hypothetical protein